MSSKSKHIVLVDPLGDILFSGESMSAREGGGAPSDDLTHDDTDAACPQTMRSAESSGSGVYRAVNRTTEPEVTLAEESSEAYDKEVPTQKKDGVRAA